MENISVDDLNRGIPFDFNEMYKGYYDRCMFTVFEYILGAYRLAGIDADGNPHIFISYTGAAWDEVPIVMNTPYGMSRRPKTPIIKILGEESEGQLYLICEGGEIVILPDCPKCIRIKDIEIPKGSRIVDAYLHKDDTSLSSIMELHLTNKEKKRIYLRNLRQYRVANSFAQRLITKGAVVIDVRPEVDDIPIEWNTAIHVPMEEISEYLEKQSHAGVLLFFCRTGRLADEVTEYSRRKGYMRAYSLGGVEDWAHTN